MSKRVPKEQYEKTFSFKFAGVFDRVFVLSHQVFVASHPDDGDFHFFHCRGFYWNFNVSVAFAGILIRCVLNVNSSLFQHIAR